MLFYFIAFYARSGLFSSGIKLFALHAVKSGFDPISTRPAIVAIAAIALQLLFVYARKLYTNLQRLTFHKLKNWSLYKSSACHVIKTWKNLQWYKRNKN